MIELYDYQARCVAGLRQAFRDGYRAPLLVSPTASGKTVMFSYLTSRLLAAGKRVQLLVHRDELLDQVSATLRDFDVPHGVVAAGSTYDRRFSAHVSSVFTLVRRLDRVLPPDYVIADEAHHAIAGSSWGKVMAAWPDARRIGVTATPERLSGEGLGATFDTLILGPTTRELIEAGRLSPYRLFAPPESQRLDLSGVHRRAGDFVRGEVETIVGKPAIIGNVVTHYRRHIDGMPSVAFCVSIAHAEAVAERFRAQGYRAVSIDGKMPLDERRARMAAFRRGELNVLCSCEVISEGLDVPGIIGALLLRPTWSLALYLQQVGRALRTAPGKDAAIILDHVGNSTRHGMPDDPREWSLIGSAGARKTKAAEDACRQCPKCYAVSPAYAAKCRECGTVFPTRPREIDEREGELSEIEVARVRREAKRQQAMAGTYEALVDLGRLRGMRSPEGWARHVMAARAAKQRRAH